METAKINITLGTTYKFKKRNVRKINYTAINKHLSIKSRISYFVNNSNLFEHYNAFSKIPCDTINQFLSLLQLVIRKIIMFKKH